MDKLILLFGICSAFCLSNSQAASTKNSEKIVGCYYESLAIFRESNGKFGISNINASLCTIVIYTFSGVLDKGTIKITDPNLDKVKNGFKRFDQFREANPTVKTLLSMAGWTQGSVNYSQVVANATLRGKLVENLVNIVLKFKFNGFDLDWEYPAQRDGSPADKKNFVLLLRELKHEFNKHSLILCVSVGATEKTAKISYDIKGVSKYSHIIHLMGFQYHSPYDNTSEFVGANAPLFKSSKENAEDQKLNVDHSVRYWIKNGADSEKIVLGISLSGNSYKLAKPITEYGRGARFDSAGLAGKYTREYGTLGYNEVCDLIKNHKWKVKYDKEQEVPYAYSEYQLASYDNDESLTAKAQYIQNMKLAGAMMFSIDTDDFKPQCGEKYILLKTVNRILRNNINF